MKKILFLMLAMIAVCLVGCSKKVEEPTPVEPAGTEAEEQNTETAVDSLEEYQKMINVVENRQDFFDESGELLYYIQKDYLTSNVDSVEIYNIVSHYPKTEIKPMEDVVIRMYPEDVYYDTTTYSLWNLHNNVLTIATANDWWWGSPHGYPSSSFENFDVTTGEVYDFPADIKDEIYQKAVDEFMRIAKEHQYMGLMGDYYDENNNRIIYSTYENEAYTLTNEQALRDLVNKTLRDNGSYYMKDDKIYFIMESAYNISDWASRGLYSEVVISNEWNI